MRKSYLAGKDQINKPKLHKMEWNGMIQGKECTNTVKVLGGVNQKTWHLQNNSNFLLALTKYRKCLQKCTWDYQSDTETDILTPIATILQTPYLFNLNPGQFLFFFFSFISSNNLIVRAGSSSIHGLTFNKTFITSKEKLLEQAAYTLQK